MAPKGIKFALFMPKGAILKIKCKKQSYLIFVVNVKFSLLGVLFPRNFRTTVTLDGAKLRPYLETMVSN